MKSGCAAIGGTGRVSIDDAAWHKASHDDGVVTGCTGWQSVQQYAELTVDGKKLVLCHYPFRTWRDIGRGSIRLPEITAATIRRWRRCLGFPACQSRGHTRRKGMMVGRSMTG